MRSPWIVFKIVLTLPMHGRRQHIDDVVVDVEVVKMM